MDEQCLEVAGQQISRSALHTKLDEFSYDSRNLSFLRRRLRLRISTRRVLKSLRGLPR